MQYAAFSTVTRSIDVGLREYMTGIYSFMAAGLTVTGLTALAVGNIPALYALLMGGPQAFIFIFSPLVMILAMSFGLNRFSPEALRMMFFGFSALMGVSMSTVFMVYAGVSIASTFLITVSAFAALSIYGITTKTNLSALGSFLLMGLVGLIVAMIANIFIASSALGFAINIIGVLIFAALTAYDTQRLQQLYLTGNATEKQSIMGALSLYLNFVNLFQFLLQFLGNRE